MRSAGDENAARCVRGVGGPISKRVGMSGPSVIQWSLVPTRARSQTLTLDARIRLYYNTRGE